jgi:hypothetical protein
MQIGFLTTIKPYFTACYRDHMLFMMDLWDSADVEGNWQAIFDSVENGSMPRAGCPEGTWTKERGQQFLDDFQNWKNSNFPP